MLQASALAFLLENLGKCVILTGAQIPLSEVRNDAVDNLLGALAIAGNYLIPEVTYVILRFVEDPADVTDYCRLFFHHTLFRGCRSTKSSSFDFEQVCLTFSERSANRDAEPFLLPICVP